ncbi:MAG: BirA family transcriptional regulator [Microbacteriaceae bacterium]|nr:BirA family transcriptional regulator [Microbacteriaceae bacterium]
MGVMDLPLSATIVPRLDVLETAGSTNDELVRRATGPDAAGWPDLAVIVTDNQTTGRGRLGRSWVSPAGKSLAISVLLRPAERGSALPIDRFGWFPLLAGLAMTRAVTTVVPSGATLKWPNDVLIDGRKVCGILSELLPDASGVVIGAGLNVSLGEADLPVDTATSLALAGVERPDPDAVLAAYLTELAGLVGDFLSAGGDAVAGGLVAAVTERCETIGRPVRVELPSGEPLLGTATAIDQDGRLIVETNTGITAVAAGDVTHLRY